MQGISDTAPTPTSQNLFKISVKELIALGAKLKTGDIEAVSTSVSLPDHPTESSLLFLSPKFSFGKLDQIQILITPENFEQDVSSQLSPKAAWVTTKDFRGLMGKVLAHFDKKPMSFPEAVSDKASVSHKAHLGAGVRIAPFAVIQEDVVLGEDVWIGAGAIIQRGAKIGKGSIIHSNVVIGHHCELGESCEIQYNTSIGSEGFGYVPRDKQAAEKIPQIGRVILGDQVDIGANVAVDRGAIGDTVIGSGTKIDNLSHIAHNCKIGRNCLLAASFKIAGSSEIGDFVTAAGDVVVADHVKITSHVVLGGRSAVTKDIETPGAYAGYPLLPIKDSMRAVASIRELPRLRKEIADLKRQLAEILTQLGK